ncbi:hypothetical protein A4G20_10560 [Pasteurellaceae bacterium RH1A]|nr:hypothetical protein A4G20_10560 [Pasteurellaceae bacterium RH1A]
MKKLILLITLFLSPLSLAFSESELVALLQQPQNVQGDFTQQRFLKSLTKPITTQGKFTLLAQKGLLWQMEKPFANQLRVRSDGIMQWNGTNWVANGKLGQAEQVRLFLGLLSGNVSGLKSQFDLSLSGDKSNWQLLLTPNSLLMKQIFDKIELSGDKLVKSIVLYEKQGDRTQIDFSQLKQNQALSEFVRSALVE